MKKIIVIAVVVLSLSMACDNIVLPPAEGCDISAASYETNVKPIIDLTCAYSGCHNGGGNAPGNYTSYQGLKSIIEDGSFINRVIDLQDNPSRGMPPDMTVYPESQQDDLSPDQMEIIQCWIDSNFPE